MKRFKNILCVLSQKGDQSQVLSRSVDLAETNQAELHVVVVAEKISIGMGMPDGGPISGQIQDVIIHEAEESLGNAITPFQHRIDIQARVLVGTPFFEVIRQVLKSGHDLVVKTAEDPNWLNRLFGSDDMHLLRKCPCPVWLLKPGVPNHFRSILAAIDLDDTYAPEELEVRRALTQKVLQLAISLSLADSAPLHIGHALEKTSMDTLQSNIPRSLRGQLKNYIEHLPAHREAYLDKLLGGLPPELTSKVPEIQPHFVTGTPREAIPALASELETDLVIMGTVARTGIPGIIVGNTAEMILSQITCSVLAVKPPGFVSPVRILGTPE